MLKKFLLFTVLFFTSTNLYADSWISYQTPNFEILATDAEDGQYLQNNIEQMKTWIYQRWNLGDLQFTSKHKIMCTKDARNFKNLFNQSIPFTKNGDIYLYHDDKFTINTLPFLLTEICLLEYEKKNNVILNLWIHKGMASLNTSIPNIKNNLGSLSEVYKSNIPCFWTKKLLAINAQNLLQYRDTDQVLFDKESAAMCLMVVKEYKMYPQSMTEINDLDNVFNKFMYNISLDIINKKTPNSYLTWSVKQ